MTQLTKLAQRKVQHICIFGDPKSGKSELAATCAQFFRKLYWVSMDAGHEVLFKLPIELQEKVEIIVLPDTKEFPVAIDTCLKLVSGAAVRICERHGQVECSVCKRDKVEAWSTWSLGQLQNDEVIVFDHISQLANSAMNFILKGKKDDYFPEWEHFRLQGVLMDKFLMNIQQAPYNVICIAHITETEMDDGTKKIVPLVGTIPFSRGSGKYFDHIIYCRVANKKHNFGSATTYVTSVLTGSRGDIVLEDSKVEEGKRLTLLPFFEGKMDVSKEPEAKELLQEVQQSIEQKEVAAELVPQSLATQTTGQVPTQIQDSDKPQAGAFVEGLHSPTKPITDEETQPLSTVAPTPTTVSAIQKAAATVEVGLTPGERAKARLAAMRAGKG